MLSFAHIPTGTTTNTRIDQKGFDGKVTSASIDIAAWTAMPGRILSVAARFPLYKTAAAHKAVEAGGKVATVVVEPQR